MKCPKCHKSDEDVTRPDGYCLDCGEKTSFAKELEQLINRHSMENASGTPDFILAGYLVGCLKTWNRASTHREEWFGRTPEPVDDPEGPGVFRGLRTMPTIAAMNERIAERCHHVTWILFNWQNVRPELIRQYYCPEWESSGEVLKLNIISSEMVNSIYSEGCNPDKLDQLRVT